MPDSVTLLANANARVAWRVSKALWYSLPAGKDGCHMPVFSVQCDDAEMMWQSDLPGKRPLQDSAILPRCSPSFDAGGPSGEMNRQGRMRGWAYTQCRVESVGRSLTAATGNPIFCCCLRGHRNAHSFCSPNHPELRGTTLSLVCTYIFDLSRSPFGNPITGVSGREGRHGAVRQAIGGCIHRPL
jgi:hypothetical protein